MKVFDLIKNKFHNSEERSQETVKNIALSFSMRVANIIAQILVVRLTVNYLNSERYGIWLTLSSIIGWITIFDLGLGHGFRNRFAEAKAYNQPQLARQYVSTTYCVVGIIVLTLLAIILFLNHFLFDWSAILKIDNSYREELTFVFAIVMFFTCINMIANIFVTLLTADQKIGYASVMQASGLYLSLAAIYIISRTTEGSLSNLALYYSGIPCILLVIVSVVMFFCTHYKEYRPSLSHVKLSLTKNIMSLGIMFFIIQISMLAVFQIINIVISRELGPDNVTQFNISNKYFNIVYMTAIIVISPLWSAFTDAFTQKDYAWMKSTYRKLMSFTGASFFIFLLLLLFSSYAYRLWLDNAVDIPFSVSAAMALLAFMQTYCAANSYIINGIGKVRIQTIVYALFAISAWFCLTYSCSFGLCGVILYTAIVYFVIGLFEHIQIVKILSKKAKGIWMK